MTDLPSSLLTLRELERQATPGPWMRSGMREILRDEDCIRIVDAQEVGVIYFPIGSKQGDKFHAAAFNDAALIAAMRNALPSLLQAAERVIELERELAEARCLTLAPAKKVSIHEGERDLDACPYSSDETRVVDFLWDAGVGGGDDPIGYLITAHRWTMQVTLPEERARAEAAEVRVGKLEEALRLLLTEVELSGNADAKDYGWPKAISTARDLLRES